MRESSQLFIGLPYRKLWLVPSDVVASNPDIMCKLLSYSPTVQGWPPNFVTPI